MDKTGQTYRSRRVGILLIDGFALMSYASVVTVSDRQYSGVRRCCDEFGWGDHSRG
jgi:hypothetical protein